MELKYFKLIKTIAEEGNIVNSSKRFFLTKSALSHQLKELVGQLGFKVFYTRRNGWKLTEEGELLNQLGVDVISKVENGFEYIQYGLKNLGLDIPVFIVTINKAKSRDILAFDEKWNDRIPLGGTFINLGSKQYLLFNSIRYATLLPKPKDGDSFSVKLKIDCTDKEGLKAMKVIKNLIEQMYQFSGMYWKSLRQQNLPAKVKYPETIAQIAPISKETTSLIMVKNRLYL